MCLFPNSPFKIKNFKKYVFTDEEKLKFFWYQVVLRRINIILEIVKDT